MDCSRNIDDILRTVPTTMPILTIQSDMNLCNLYVTVQRNTGEEEESNGESNGESGDGSSGTVPVVDCSVTRHVLTNEQTSSLRNILNKCSVWRKKLPGALARMSTSPSVDRASASGVGVDTDGTAESVGSASSPISSDAMQDQFNEIVHDMNQLLDPFVRTTSVMSVLRRGNPSHCVVSLDLRLQPLPLELLPCLQDWHLPPVRVLAGGAAEGTEDEIENSVTVPEVVAPPSLSRDFSLHVLGSRLMSSGAVDATSIPTTQMGSLKYVIDPRNEDRGEEKGNGTKDVEDEEIISTVDTTFSYLKEKYSSGSWEGLCGKETVPSWAEWQRTLLGATGGGSSGGGVFLSYGLGPTLAHFPPGRLAGTSNFGVRLALLVGRSATESSLRRLAKLANKKTTAEIRLEGSVETSVLMTLAGVDTVVVNGWAASLSSNRRFMLRVMPKLVDGISVARAVAESMEMVGSGGSGGSGGGKDGKKKKKGESKEVEDEGVLKTRVQANPTVYGLPHLVVGK